MDAKEYSDSHRDSSAGDLLRQSKGGQRNLRTFECSVSIELVSGAKERWDDTNGAQSTAAERGDDTGLRSAAIYEPDSGRLWGKRVLWDA